MAIPGKKNEEGKGEKVLWNSKESFSTMKCRTASMFRG